MQKGAMLGLWRGCTRYLPGSYMCMDEFPEEEVLSDDEDSSENRCKYDSEDACANWERGH